MTTPILQIICAIAAGFLLIVRGAPADGVTPVKSLKLTGPADGGGQIITNLYRVAVTSDAAGADDLPRLSQVQSIVAGATSGIPERVTSLEGGTGTWNQAAAAAASATDRVAIVEGRYVRLWSAWPGAAANTGDCWFASENGNHQMGFYRDFGSIVLHHYNRTNDQNNFLHCDGVATWRFSGRLGINGDPIQGSQVGDRDYNDDRYRPQSSTNDTPTLFTPRCIGDELIIYVTTNRIYRAFGLTTNDWE